MVSVDTDLEPGEDPIPSKDDGIGVIAAIGSVLASLTVIVTIIILIIVVILLKR